MHLGPVFAQMLAVQIHQERGGPATEMGAIRNMADGHSRRLGFLRIQNVPHLPGHLAVAPAHAVGLTRHPQGQHGQAKGLPGIANAASTQM